MFDLDAFITDCQGALAELEERLAVKEVIERAVADPNLPNVLTPTRAEIVKLHVATT